MDKVLRAEGLNEANREEGFLSIQRAVHILGGKWSFTVLARLYCRPHRFNQLRRDLGAISTKSLTDTLRHLERNKMIQRKVFPTVPITVEYSLTEKGEAFQAVLVEMYKWGHTWASQPDESASEKNPPVLGSLGV
ncbi:MAG: winged helix-turn-helix transcriptional regulator [Thermomicrobiales bacterium]